LRIVSSSRVSRWGWVSPCTAISWPSYRAGISRIPYIHPPDKQVPLLPAARSALNPAIQIEGSLYVILV
jgi:hypothetical protein